MKDRILVFTLLILGITNINSGKLPEEFEDANNQVDCQSFGGPILKKFPQSVNHFNILDRRKWFQYYYEYDSYYDGLGPAYIHLGGAVPLGPGNLGSGILDRLAQSNHGIVFQIEHRFYGKSKPFSEITLENLKYLNVEQTLADYAHFIGHLRESGRINAETPIIIYGLSYAGNLAAWMRLKYPHLVKGGIASGAPMDMRMEFREFMNPILKLLVKNGPECLERVRLAFCEIEENYTNPLVQNYIKDFFNLCKVPNIPNAADSRELRDGALTVLINAAMLNRINPVYGVPDLELKCTMMTYRSEHGTPLERLSMWRPYEGLPCFDYESLVHPKVTFNDHRFVYKYQQCTQLGLFVQARLSSGDRDTQPFTECVQYFGLNFDLNQLRRRLEDLQLTYGGIRNPGLKDMIFINGLNDPWYPLFIKDATDKSVRVISVDNAGHGNELLNSEFDANPELVTALEIIKQIVNVWLDQ